MFVFLFIFQLFSFMATDLLANDDCPCKKKRRSTSLPREIAENISTSQETIPDKTSPPTLENLSSLYFTHFEGSGIAYNRGYTSARLFIAPLINGDIIPFINFRAHIFNSGKFAGNSGVGVRAKYKDSILGINGFFDMRNYHDIDFEQFSFGLEYFLERVSFSLNGYFPIGTKIKYRSYRSLGGDLYRETGHLAMTGGDLICIVDAYHEKPLDFFISLSPYYFKGSFGKKAAGGKAGVQLSLYDLFYLGGNISYDELFKTRYEGTIGLTFYFGGTNIDRNENLGYKTSGIPSLAKCSSLLRSRMKDEIHKKEILVVSKQSRTVTITGPAPGGQ